MSNDQCVYEILTAIEKGQDDSNKVVFIKDLFFQHKSDFDDCIFDILKPKVPIWEQDGNEIKCDNYLVILKRFNSFTPTLSHQIKYCKNIQEEGETPEQKEEAKQISRGGGCFLKWQGKGIAIDPGFNYISNLAKVGLSIGNIDAIIITHGHNDHYIDLDPILTLLYELNDLYDNIIAGLKNLEANNYEEALLFFKRGIEINYTDDICQKGESVCLSKLVEGEYGQFDSDKDELLTIWNSRNSDDSILMDWKKQLKKIDLFLGRSAAKTVNSFTSLQLQQVRNVYLLNPGINTSVEGYLFDIYPVTAKHWDFYGKSHCIGLRFNLKDRNHETILNLGYTSDTGYYFNQEKINSRITQKELYQEYYGCNILVAHIGSASSEDTSPISPVLNTGIPSNPFEEFKISVIFFLQLFISSPYSEIITSLNASLLGLSSHTNLIRPKMPRCFSYKYFL